MDRAATVMVNPLARGVARRFDAQAALERLASHGFDARVCYPRTPEAARRTAREVVARHEDCLFVVGGDGTMRVVAEALRYTDTALAALPLGTANVWAREVGIPRDLAGAIDAHASGQIVRIDLGRVNDEPFILMASAGWDADIVHRVATGWVKQVLGEGAYVVAGLRRVMGLRPHEVRWSIDGRERTDDLVLIVASNTRLYGGRVTFTPVSTAIDGELDVVALRPGTPLDTVRLAGKLASGVLHEDRSALQAFTREVRIDTPGLPVQADGDAIGTSPCTIRVEPGALLVSVPSGPLPGVLTPRGE